MANAYYEIPIYWFHTFFYISKINIFYLQTKHLFKGFRYFVFVFVFHLKGRIIEEEIDLTCPGSLHKWPQWQRAGPDWNQEPRAPFGFPMWVLEVQAPESSSAFSTLTGSWIGSEAARTKANTLVWNTGTWGCSLIHSVIAVVPKLIF